MGAIYFKYWGKAKANDTGSIGDVEYHLLPFHCLDVVAVADVWLEKSAVMLNQISSQTGKSVKESKAIVLFYIALHDLGKFDARFQEFVPHLRKTLQGEDWEVSPEKYNHGSYGYIRFTQEFIDSPLMKSVAGHHGYCDTGIRFFDPDADDELINQDIAARQQWIDYCLKWFGFDEIPISQPISLLAGLCSVSDWIGSSITNFTTDPNIDLKEYYKKALPRAKAALEITGMLSSIKGSGFGYLFPEYTPRGIQVLIPDLPVSAGLTVVESDTGSGKTEFAVSYASALIYNGIADGVVFGLPTQATANGLFHRIGDAANRLFPDSTLTLAHSKSKYLIPDQDGFLHQSSKRAFLGSMSVATVDQILMGVLPIKHQFVRSFGTRKSVLILDEIHSFDSYMIGLITSVLKGQHEAFSSAILLSATLPDQLKGQLLESYGGQAQSDSYPLVTHVNLSGKTMEFEPEKTTESRRIICELNVTSDQLPTPKQSHALLESAKAGAMICIICNTVQSSQILYQRMSQMSHYDIDLFHARFSLEDRLRIEKKVLEKYGKTSPRNGGLLIATQVVEQSLDLDFDIMISQIAPIEFLMQRMGRLWRHDRRHPNLPARTLCVTEPKFITLAPPVDTQDVPLESAYGGSGYVYRNIRSLYRTQRYLERHSFLDFPVAYKDALSYVHAIEAFDDEPGDLATISKKFSNEEEGSFYSAIGLSNKESRPLNDVDPRSALLTREGEMSESVVLFSTAIDLLHGGSYSEQSDRERNTVSLSKKITKGIGQRDDDFHCLKVIVGEDINYNELGVYDERATEQVD